MEYINIKESLSASQMDIYLDQQLYSDKPLYNIGGYIELAGSLDLDILVKAHSILTLRADAFSIRVLASNYGVKQIVGEPSTSITTVDFSGHPNPDIEANDYISKVYDKPFEFDGSPLFRTGIIILGDGRYWYYGIAHHVILDGWGFSNWVGALVTIYNQLDQQGQSDYSPYSFLDMVEQDSLYRQSSRYEKDKQYWLSMYETLPNSLLIQKYGFGKDNQPLPSQRVSANISQQLFEQHKKFARHLGGSVVQLYLSALYVYFSRIYENQDLVFGLPIHNRRTSKDKKTIGTCLSVSAQRFNYSCDLTAGELFNAMLKEQSQSLRHQRFPLGDLYHGLKLRAKNRKRLFDISFNYQLLDYSYVLNDATVSSHYLTNGWEQTPLNFTICEFGQQQDIVLHLDYNLLHLNQVEAELLLSRWQLIVEQIVCDPTVKISQLLLLSEGDRRLLRCPEMSALTTEFDLVDMFIHQSNIYADKHAIEFAGTGVSYYSLAKKIDEYAVRFYELGMRPQDRIGICVQRSDNMLALMLSAMKLNLCYVPMDPDFPEHTLNQMVSAAKLKLVITDPTDRFASSWKNVKQLTTDEFSSVASDARHLPVIEKSPDDIAYILFTSGSTGTPKGVAVSHRALSNFMQSMKSKPGFSADDRLLAVTTVSFDIAGLELFLPLISGGTVVILDKDSARNGHKLLRICETQRITIMQATPASWKLMLEADWRGALPLKALCGGEALPIELATKLLPKVAELWNMYGPTETTIWSCIKRIESAQNINLGQPIDNTALFIVDRYQKQVPYGEIGELWIAGAGLAKGYFDQPEMTTERFFNWQDHNKTTFRVYKTGDLARFTASGDVEYFGRNDNQVKFNGFRIELGNVESTIVKFAGVTDCMVAIQAHPSRAKQAQVLSAYITTSQPVDIEHLKVFVTGLIPSYMVPSHWGILNELPLTLNGKKDRSQLPTPQVPDFVKDVVVPPSSEVEGIILNAWQKILDRTEISVEHNLFDLGASSLDVMKVSKELEQSLGIELSVINLFEFSTIRLLANYISTAGSIPSWNDRSQQLSAGKNRLANRRLRKKNETAVS